MAGNPAHPLLAVANRSAEAHPKDRQHLAEGAAIGAEDNPDPQDHDAGKA